MAGAQDHLLQIALAIAECCLGLAAALADLILKLALVFDGAHATPAAAPGRLEHQGIADLLGLLADVLDVIAQNFGRGDDGHARLDGHAPRACLVAKRAHGFGTRADKGDPRRVASIYKGRIFRQEAIAGMDRIRARELGHADDFLDRQIGLNRPHALADAICLVRLEAVQPELVLFGEDSDGFLAHFIGSPHDADGDFAPVGDENFLEVGHACPPVYQFWRRGRLCRIAALHPCRICERFVQSGKLGIPRQGKFPVPTGGWPYPEGIKRARTSQSVCVPNWPMLARKSSARISARCAGPLSPKAPSA